jgi:hypothetical protein
MRELISRPLLSQLERSSRQAEHSAVNAPRSGFGIARVRVHVRIFELVLRRAEVINAFARVRAIKSKRRSALLSPCIMHSLSESRQCHPFGKILPRLAGLPTASGGFRTNSTNCARIRASTQPDKNRRSRKIHPGNILYPIIGSFRFLHSAALELLGLA